MNIVHSRLDLWQNSNLDIFSPCILLKEAKKSQTPFPEVHHRFRKVFWHPTGPLIENPTGYDEFCALWAILSHSTAAALHNTRHTAHCYTTLLRIGTYIDGKLLLLAHHTHIIFCKRQKHWSSVCCDVKTIKEIPILGGFWEGCPNIFHLFRFKLLLHCAVMFHVPSNLGKVETNIESNWANEWPDLCPRFLPP